MERHTITYVRDGLNQNSEILSEEVEPSFSAAQERIAQTMPLMRARFGSNAGCIIKDSSGKTVLIVPRGVVNTPDTE